MIRANWGSHPERAALEAIAAQKGPGAVDGAIEQICAGFAVLAAVDLIALTGTEVLELVQSTQRVRSMADAACVQAAGAMDVSHAWTGDGARSPSARGRGHRPGGYAAGVLV
ncbi:MAG: hypothetical protein ABIP36_08265 [Acidimicrobiales bacterium]